MIKSDLSYYYNFHNAYKKELHNIKYKSTWQILIFYVSMRFAYKFKNIFNIIELQNYKRIGNYLPNRMILTIVL